MASLALRRRQNHIKCKKKKADNRPPQLVEKAIFDFYASCGSTHSIEFALQIHKFREHGPDHPLLPLCGNSPCVSRNLYKGRKNVPVRARFFFSIRSKAWFRARGCSENDSFSTASEAHLSVCLISFSADILFAGADGVPRTSTTNILQHDRCHLCVNCTDQVLINIHALVQIKVFDCLSVKAGDLFLCSAQVVSGMVRAVRT